MSVKPVPDGYHTVTPYISVRGVSAVVDFVKRAFEAVEIERLELPDGTLKHAEVQIGDSKIMMGETPDGWDQMPALLYLYVPDVDTTFARAVEAGASVVEKLTDQFYGDRSGGVRDAAGNVWYVSTHVEDVSQEELERRMAEQGDPPAPLS